MNSLFQYCLISFLSYVICKEGEVYDLTESSFNKIVMEDESIWFISFFAPWCGHCKSLEPQWKSAALEMKGKVKFGIIDATVSPNLAAQFSVNSYPTIKIFDTGVKETSRAIPYEGGRIASDFVRYATDMFRKNEPATPIYQLLNRDQLDTLCTNNQLCFVAFLPHILDCQSSCRNDYLELMRVMSEKYKQYDYGYTWVEGMSQPLLEKEVGIGGFGYPAMIAINSRKMKFASHKGSFGKESLNEFYRSFNGGRIRVNALTEIPTIVEMPPWDGKDGTIPEMEDIDLSDVDFDDEPLNQNSKNEL